MSTAPRSPGRAPSPVGTIALFYQWYNYETIRRAAAPAYFTDNGISAYSWNFSCAKNCKIQFDMLEARDSKWWLTFTNGGTTKTISDGLMVELKKGDTCKIGYSHSNSSSGAGFFMLIANFVK